VGKGKEEGEKRGEKRRSYATSTQYPVGKRAYQYNLLYRGTKKGRRKERKRTQGKENPSGARGKKEKNRKVLQHIRRKGGRKGKGSKRNPYYPLPQRLEEKKAKGFRSSC